MSGNFSVPGAPGPRGKRMLPSVSDVVKQLQGSSSHEPGLLFKAARQVCADELARVKQGFEAAPLEVLVERARVLLDPSLAAAPPTDLGSLFEPGPPQPPAPSSSDDPFNETTGALDLKWEAPTGAGPSATEILPLGTLPPPPGPGDETLAGLEREAHALDLRSEEPWHGAEVPHGRGGRDTGDEGEKPYEESRPVFSPPRSSSRSPLLFVVIALALVGAGFGAWKLLAPRFLGTKEAAPAPVVRRPRPTPSGSAPVAIAPESASGAPSAAPAPTATPLAIAARPTAAPAPTAALRPTRVVAAPPTAVPAVPTRVAAAPPTPAPAARATRPGPKFVPKAQPMVSPDWAGKPGVYVVHFTSYRDRKPAELDAARLTKQLGHPGHAIQVDLGAKGVWYRAVVGDFATVEEAKDFRAQLAAQKVPSLGLVYYLTD